jgi:hypothetical protein
MALALFLVTFLAVLASLFLGLVSVIAPSKVPWVRSRKHGAFVFFAVSAPISFVAMAATSIYLAKIEGPRQGQLTEPTRSAAITVLSERATEPLRPAPAIETDEEKLRLALGKALSIPSIQIDKAGSGPRITVRHRIGMVWSEAGVVTANARAIEIVAKAALKLFPDLSSVTVEAETDVTDLYGREGIDKTLGFTISGDDLRKINWENIYSARVLDIVQVRPSFVGKRAILQYCDDIKLGEPGAIFCLRAISGSSN